ncbi:sugar transporter [Bisgaard Taxon 10/6]|uniref:sugar transporter n=1 Tax=Exercitatus varius TaxID=67857 RepID=UPI00294B38DF|nr:sugar transporter [Exercitatus varius]MDG2948821.1 sugar transporter [Exercitatus varius]
MFNTAKFERLANFRIIAIAFAAFIFNTTEFVPVALLSDIAQSFAMPVSQTGLMITVYAWIVSLMSLPLMLITAKSERRSLLLKLFLLFVSGHILSVIAWNYGILVVSRILIALAHAVFWSITAALAMRIAPKGKQTQALGMIAMGSSMAMVLGLPLGRIIGQWLGWRTTFALIALSAFVVMLVLAKLLPHLPSKNAGSFASLPSLVKRPLLMGSYAVTVLIISAHFTAYSYIEPFVKEIGGMTEGSATLVLLIFGLAGFVASFLFGRIYRFSPIKFVMSSMGLLILSLCSLYLLSGYTALMLILIFVWGIGISGLSIGLQMRVLQQAPDATDVATAIYSGIYNVGIGGGALIGNQVMRHWGLGGIGFAGALIGVLGIALFVVLHLKYRNVPSE